MAVVRVKSKLTGIVTWAAIVNYVDDTGKRRQIKRLTKTRNEAKKAESDLIQERKRGESVPASGERAVTVGHFLDRWLAAQTQLKASSLRRYTIALKPVSETLGAVALAKLQPIQIVAMNRELGVRLAPKTLRLTHALLSQALNDAVRWGVVSRNVATLVTAPRDTPKEPYTLTIEDLRNVFAAAADTRIAALVPVAAWSGLRLGELLALTWADIESSAARVTISKARSHTGEVTAPKTDRSRRRVTLSPETIAILDALPRDGAGPFALTHRQVEYVWDQVRTKAGVPRARFHDLRHAHATHLLAAGWAVPVVSARLGHSSSAITMRVYAHALPDQDVELAKGISKVMQ